MDPEKKETIAIHFQILKQTWDQWTEKNASNLPTETGDVPRLPEVSRDTPSIPRDTERFFIGLTGRYFNEAMHTTLQGQKAPFSTLAGDLPAEESWKLMKAYFNKLRPRAEHTILNSIFAEALAHSGKELSDALTSDLSNDVYCLLGKYRQYCFSAVRDFYGAERFPKPADRWVTDSGNAPVGDEDVEGAREVFDTIRAPAPEFSPEEEAEFRAIAQSRSKEYFQRLDTTRKAGLFATYTRNCAGVKLRYDDPAIAEFVTVTEKHFYEVRKTAQSQHIEDFRQTAIWKGEDPDAQQRLEELLLETLLEESALWFAEQKPESVSSILGDRLQAIARFHSRESFESVSDKAKAALFCLYVKQQTGRALSFDDPLIAEWTGTKEEWDPESGTHLLNEHLTRFRQSANWFVEAESNRKRIEGLLRETLLEESFLWFSRKKPNHVSSLNEGTETNQ